MNTIVPYPTQVKTLANGLRVIFLPMPANGLVAYWTIVCTGSGQEFEPGRSGFAHFFEHMMFRGTERFPSEVYQNILTKIGADANAYTTDDLTAYHASLASEDLATVIELESDRFKNLAYPEADFRTEAGAVYGEYRKSRTDPLFALYEQLMATAFQTHPYGHTTLGHEADIAAMPEMYEYSREFFARHYRPDNSLIFVAGDFDTDQVQDLIEQHYGDWQPGYVPPPVPEEPEQTSERRVDVTYEGQTLPIVWIACKLDRFDPQNTIRTAADLMADLAFGPTSATYKRLILDEQVVEFLHAGADMNRDPGLFNVYARVKDPAKIDHVLDVIGSTLDRFIAVAPDAESLAAAQSRERYDFLMNLDTPDTVAEQLARIIAIDGGIEAIDVLHATYARVVPRDIQAAANSYLGEPRRTIGILRSKD